jgi:large subunit ribosomal protein L21
MELAVIKTGGKQYLVYPGKKIQVEKIEKEGEVIFDEVLLFAKNGEIKIGKPLLESVKVNGKILGQKKGKKIVILKHRPRSSYKVKKGHRQIYSEVEITKIEVQ